ncbi:MAG: hypothetical protein A2X48_14805 [Lentisphaerae bacterium GWF2_49_21]|nr:MAG: hypothetical protein A2X48_14805 [Lentisphaerae bacterium GWF2_49_21]
MALQDSEVRYRRLFETDKDGILLLDFDTGMITDVNNFINELLGYSHEELLGMHLWDVGPFKDVVSSKDAFLRLQAEDYIRYEDLPLETRDGRKVEVEFISNVYQADGRKFIQCNIRDITGRRRAEVEKAGLEAQLRHSQKMDAIGQLAGGVAHDFNNMLSVINGYAAMLLLEVPPSDRKYPLVQEISKAGKRSADLTRQLLAFARRQTIAPEVLDLNASVAGMLNMLQRLIGENIELTWKPAANLWKVKMDPSQLDQILANLIVNARDAVSGAGRIAIETGKADLDEAFCRTHLYSVQGKYVILSVSDNGCGMDKKTLEHIYEPFFTTKKVGEGTGLGLATVFGIVKQNNGIINVNSEPGKGTTFKIYLPQHESENREGDEKPEEPGMLIRGTETILLLEDEKALLQFAKTLLERLGYTVLTAGSPGQAIRLAGEYKGDIHLLMTDMIMPEMNGQDLKGKINEIRSGIKCLFMSGYTADVMSRNGVLDKGIHFLQKPFTAEDLSVKLREALS